MKNVVRKLKKCFFLPLNSQNRGPILVFRYFLYTIEFIRHNSLNINELSASPLLTLREEGKEKDCKMMFKN